MIKKTPRFRGVVTGRIEIVHQKQTYYPSLHHLFSTQYVCISILTQIKTKIKDGEYVTVAECF